MARFFAIAAPPQSLDALDGWGPLDSLPAPLDSQLWERAGIWGFEAAEGASSAQGLCLGRRVSLRGSLRASAAASLALVACQTLGGGAAARAGGAAGLNAVRAVELGAGAASFGACRGVRAFYLALAGGARGRDLPAVLRRILHVGVGSAACGSGGLGLVQVCLLCGRGQGSAAAQCAFRPKGWAWQSAGPLRQDWTPEAEARASWTEKQSRRTDWL